MWNRNKGVWLLSDRASAKVVFFEVFVEGLVLENGCWSSFLALIC